MESIENYNDNNKSGVKENPNNEEIININYNYPLKEDKKRRKKKKKGKKGKKTKKSEDDIKSKQNSKKGKKSIFSSEQFIINGNYNLIKMLGFGAFGEIHLAYDTILKQLRAIKFEVASHKNPQLKHEYLILEQLNKLENKSEIVGIPRVYGFDRMENKYNYMIMDFLGPSLSDLHQFKEKHFSLETVLMIGIQMLNRIEYIHEKGFIHRDIKPENFTIGIDEKTNIIHIIDFGLSRRYKDKSTGQHIQYRENRHLVGTVRYASVNSHLGIEQSRRDDIESIGYVLVYFYLGRLPWQSSQDKGKGQTNSIMEKKLITPPEILCKKMPSQFSFYFHYCKNLKFEDRPDYLNLRTLFAEILYSKIKIGSVFTFDWFNDNNDTGEFEIEEKNYSSNIINDSKTDIDKRTPSGEEENSPLIGEVSKSNEESNGIGEQLKINNIIKDVEEIEIKKKDNPLGVVEGKHEESKSSVSDSESEESEIGEGVKKNSSDSNYNILKSDSPQDNKKKDENNEEDDKEDNDVKLIVREEN